MRSNSGLLRRPIRPEQYATEFTTAHGMRDPPVHKFCFGIVCPTCSETIPMAVESPETITLYLRCDSCGRAIKRDETAFDQFVEEEYDE